MPPHGFKTISIPEETYKEIEQFFNEERDTLKKKGIKSLSSWVTTTLYEAISVKKTEQQSFTSKQYWENNKKIKIKPRILIIDDDKELCNVLKIIFEQEGYEVSTAYNGKEAIQKSRNKFFNASLVDLKLPDISSDKLLGKLENISPDTIRIVITGNSSLDMAINAINHGAAGYITKPINPEKLLVTIKTRIAGREKHYEVTEERIFRLIKDRVNELINNRE